MIGRQIRQLITAQLVRKVCMPNIFNSDLAAVTFKMGDRIDDFRNVHNEKALSVCVGGNDGSRSGSPLIRQLPHEQAEHQPNEQRED